MKDLNNNTMNECGTNTDKKVNKNKIKSFKWICKNSKGQLFSIILLVIAYSVLAYVGIYSALIAKDVIDSAVNKDYNGIVYSAIIFGAVIIAQLLIRSFAGHYVFKFGARLEIGMRTRLFGEILKKDYFYISAYHTGDLLNRLTSDITKITSAITAIIPQVAFLVVKLGGIFVVLWAVDKRFALVFIFGGILVYFVSMAFKTKLKVLHKKVQETDGKVRSFMQEVLANLLVVKVFDADDEVLNNANTLQEDNYSFAKKRNYFTIFSSNAFSFVFSLAYLYGLIWGGCNIIDGAITYGTLTAVLTLITQIQTPIMQFTNILPRYYEAIGSAERIIEIERIQQETSINKEVSNINITYNQLNKICFENISFKYDRDIVLDNVDLSINKGDFAVITGQSGAGKSTLIKLLMGVYAPNQGKIYLDNANGHNMVIDKSLRKLFAYVPQGNFLISGTIRDNIAFTNPNATEQMIINAANVSCANDFIESLPMGYDTLIGEKGMGLSEGQIQRVAIARAILCEAPILILDESTSALDEQTERRLLGNIKLLQNKTCIIISHKKAAFDVCNKHIIFDNKHISVLEN